MSTAKSRRESNWKQRKQNQQPHGKIKSLEEYADELGVSPAEGVSSSQPPTP
ncbi:MULTISPECIES: DUF6254 family protein [unclassified Paenibacillus]|uniref:DUF6254 family protein n=1 Tax=unclassified Paenibacillus TaxID=185978 RepID=UPI000954BAA9|nr:MULTISPECIES: DUF6254 family protein [unclassified Paenibacillus]SIR39489.1 hypothetical protein SAMN05880555_3636 [Paenibacillus sp. RU4X]SIR49955.1 hypothetical protein SAMN05880570_3637 [Paenibacillus sp. RU4T]